MSLVEVWIARNETIFNDRFPKEVDVVTKIKGLLLEIISNIEFDFKLLAEASTWLGPRGTGERKCALRKPVTDPPWHLCIFEEDFLSR